MVTKYIKIEEFAGGGGATTGHRLATGHSIDLAVNHSVTAVAMHAINHPETLHFCQDVWKVDPLDALDMIAKLRGWSEAFRVAVASGWFSPDCKHFSKAKGGALVDKRIRGLAYILLKWCGRGNRHAGAQPGGLRRRGPACPLVLFGENVEEFKTWGPLIAKRDPAMGRVLYREVRDADTGKILIEKGRVAAPGERVPYHLQWLVPDPKRAGLYFLRFVRTLREFGGVVEWRELPAYAYGAPTIRKRLYFIVRFDGEPIVWPEPTHGDPASPEVQSGKLLPWRTAADILDFALPCPSLFLTRKQARRVNASRPLADATMARVAEGVRRYVLEDPEPFIANLTHGVRIESVKAPLNVVTGAHRGEKALVTPFVAVQTSGHSGSPVDEPVKTIATGGHHALVSPVLVGCGGRAGESRPRSVTEPTATTTAKADTCVATCELAPMLVGAGGPAYSGKPRPANKPFHTLTTENHTALAAVNVVKLRGDNVGHSLTEPAHTVSAGGQHLAVAAMSLTKFNTGAVGSPVTAPVPTLTANSYITRPGGCASIGTVAAFLAQHNGGEKGNQTYGHEITAPVSTLSAKCSQQQLVGASLVAYYGSEAEGQGAKEPLRTVTVRERFGLAETAGAIPPLTPALAKKARRVARFLRKHGVEVPGEFATVRDYVIVDIGMRMLTPRELFRAQGFPEDYIIDRGLKEVDGRMQVVPLTKTEQVQMCGNSVCPPVAAALIAANPPRLDRNEAAA